MKNLKEIALFVLTITVAVSVALFLLLVVFDMAHAKRVATREGDTLVIRDVPEAERIPGVPDGLLEEQALELVDGKRNEVVIENGYKGTVGHKLLFHSLIVPSLFITSTHIDKVITWDGKHWLQRPAKPRVITDDSFSAAFVFLWVPSLMILLVSISTKLRGVASTRILMFYVSVFASVVLALIARTIPVSADACVIIATFGGAIIIGFTGLFTLGLEGIVGGIGVGVLFGVLTGILARQGNDRDLVYSVLFLIVAEAVSFFLATGSVHLQKMVTGWQKQGSTE